MKTQERLQPTEAQLAAPFDGAQDALRFILDVWQSIVVRGDVYALVRLDRGKCREAGQVMGEMVEGNGEQGTQESTNVKSG